ncbi:NTP transferase domain-containing protein [Candidatus Nomurabacteria bacterium]|nr:NTP transferase domain-containing protein [Candidatus Nomurabacteria bacterium]
MTTISNAFILAAGLGTRLRPFTDTTPKSLLPLMGIPIIQFVIDLLNEAQVKRVVINMHHLPHVMQEGLKKLDIGDMELIISDESTQLLGSGGGIKKAASYFQDSPFFMLNGDSFCNIDLQSLAKWHGLLKQNKKNLLTMAVMPEGENLYTEIFINKNTYQIKKLGASVQGRPFYSGISVIEPEALQNLPENTAFDFLKEILMPQILLGQAYAYLFQCPFIDAGTPELLQKAQTFIAHALENSSLPPVWAKRIRNPIP